ncbi:MAG: hypothetical protein ACT4N4_07510 [Rhodospirillales bacterium]
MTDKSESLPPLAQLKAANRPIKTIHGRMARKSGKAVDVEATIYSPTLVPETGTNPGACYVCVISIPLIREEDFFCCGLDEQQAFELSEAFVKDMFAHFRVERV